MLAAERKQLVLDLIYRDRRVVVADLSRQFGVTEETVRRDLHKLEQEGLVSRTHGGAVARDIEVEDLPYRTRQTTNIAAKRRIALLAAKLVADGSAVMLDSSSTAYEAMHPLKERHDLTFITNAVRIVADPNVTPHAIICVGGELRRRSMTFVGSTAIQAIAQFNADLAFVSCKALSLDHGVMDASMSDAEVKRAFIRNARRVCLLADGDKFGRTALTAICGFDQIDMVVTDRQPDERWTQFLAQNQVELIH